MAILIKQASYVVRSADRVERDTDILIEGPRITTVGQIPAADMAGLQVLDGRGRAVIPGLVNAHTHLYQNFLKGLNDDIGLVAWCNATLYPLAYAIHQAHWGNDDESCGYHWATLSALEMIRGGVTCCVDMNMNMDSVFRGWQECGIRGVGAVALSDRWLPASLCRDPEASRQEALRLARNWHGAHPRIETVLAPSTPFLCSKELLLWARDRAEELGIGYVNTMDRGRSGLQQPQAVGIGHGGLPRLLENLRDLVTRLGQVDLEADSDLLRPVARPQQ